MVDQQKGYAMSQQTENSMICWLQHGVAAWGWGSWVRWNGVPHQPRGIRSKSWHEPLHIRLFWNGIVRWPSADVRMVQDTQSEFVALAQRSSLIANFLPH
jgi:hypothetical protein